MAIGVLAAERFTDGPAGAAILSLLTLLAVVVRLVLSLRESQGEASRELRREALTDALTGLANRRALMADLDGAVARPPRDRRRSA